MGTGTHGLLCNCKFCSSNPSVACFGRRSIPAQTCFSIFLSLVPPFLPLSSDLRRKKTPHFPPHILNNCFVYFRRFFLPPKMFLMDTILPSPELLIDAPPFRRNCPQGRFGRLPSSGIVGLGQEHIGSFIV